MKYTVHVDVSYSVDIDPKALGIKTKKELLDYAKANYPFIGKEFDINAKIFEKYDDQPTKPKPRKGVGSY